jgi:hypothetical protein
MYQSFSMRGKSARMFCAVWPAVSSGSASHAIEPFCPSPSQNRPSFVALASMPHSGGTLVPPRGVDGGMSSPAIS